MELFGLDLQTISRLQGGSVVKSASYILRENLYDEYQQKTHYYSHIKDLLHWEILLPENAPKEFHDLHILLTAIDQAEKRYDARTGRSLRLSLPNDMNLSTENRIALVRDYIKEVFVAEGMCALLAIHEGKNVEAEKNNPHAHVILTDRPVDTNGFCSHKNRDWNQKSQLRKWRRLWAEYQNRLFKEKSLDLEVSHESLEVQGIDRKPTRPLGRAATALERKGIRTEVGNRNREIEARQREQEEQRQHRRERLRNRGRSR